MTEEKRYEQYMYSYPHKRAYGPLAESMAAEAFEQLKGQEVSLYVHVPFCSAKCGYCNLFSVAVAGEQLMGQYTEAVCRQAGQYAGLLREKPVHVSQVIFGGGTPWILSINQLESLFSAMECFDNIRWNGLGFDIETSPKETTKEKAVYLKQRGLRRISIGIQSFCDDELKRIYRQHDSHSCHRALKVLKDVKPDCLNIDLIYGIEGQTLQSFGESLAQALFYEPEELFLYPLYVRRGTLLEGRMEPDEGLQEAMYKYAAERLDREGYLQTSMRRFVRRNAGSDSSLDDTGPGCGFERTLALGCGGRSYAGDIHFCEPYEVEAGKCKGILQQFVEKQDFLKGLKGYRLDEDEQMRRFVIKNLGYYRGVPEHEFRQHFGKDLYASYESLWETLEKNKLVVRRGGRMILTVEGLGDSDRILAKWISGKVRRSMDK